MSGVVNTDLTYEEKYFNDLDVTAQFSYVHVDTDAEDLHLYPPGAFGGAFPEGVRQQFSVEESRLRAELIGLFSGLDHHVLRLGLGGFYDTFDQTEERRNFRLSRGLLLPTGVFAERGGVGDVALFPDTERSVFFSYLQDEWLIAPDWHLTSGVRLDRYSDFGATVNPRMGLVWGTNYSLTTKLLYGRAFRPPSPLELESDGLFIGLGNPDLEPTTIDTVELSFNYRVPWLRSGLHLFWYDHDLITLVPNPLSPNGLQFSNAGEQQGYGLELEVAWDLAPSVHLRGNYAYLDRRGQEDNVNSRFAPRHQVYAEANWHPAPDWTINANVKSVLDRERPTGDPRTSADDYSIVNLTVRRRNIANHVDAAVSIRNLLDADAREPSDSATSLPFDIPLAGRHVYGELRFRF